MKKDVTTLQNDMGVDKALSVKDLDMSLHYVLDQLAPLDAATLDIIAYF